MQRQSIPDMLTLLRRSESGPALIDVRSEVEAAKASIPGFVNLPILYQAERHDVGITYKHEGQQAAIDRGAALVLPHRDERVAGWSQAIAASPSRSAVVACWRGGMRSQIACGWLAKAGHTVYQLEGGYKALRQELLAVLATTPPMVVVAGMTGVGKTDLLLSLAGGVVDLEGAARHRGSAFGGWIDQAQPAQATFENALALQLLRVKSSYTALFCEDESRTVGTLAVPDTFYEGMTHAPLLVLEEPLEVRTRRIFRDYVEQPVRAGLSIARVRQKAFDSLQAVGKRLSYQAAPIQALMVEGFAKSMARGMRYEYHEPWLAALLTSYYDKGYSYGMKLKGERPVLFKGDLASCKQWCDAYLQAHRQA